MICFVSRVFHCRPETVHEYVATSAHLYITGKPAALSEVSLCTTTASDPEAPTAWRGRKDDPLECMDRVARSAQPILAPAGVASHVLNGEGFADEG